MKIEETDVVIIGAGASGIAGLRQLSSNTTFKIICLELRSKLGGVWNYEPDPGPCQIHFDDRGHPVINQPPRTVTPMYANLRTNVPKRLMEFDDQAFEPSDHSFLSHQSILSYLERSSGEVNHLIRFDTDVRSVYHRRLDQPTSRRWSIEYTDLSLNHQDEIKILYCDYVIAANGHNCKAYIPPIKGLSTWTYPISHSLFYRKPTDAIFQNAKSIAVIGLGPSGYDILRELSSQPNCPKLYAISNHPPHIGWDFNDPLAPDWTRRIICRPSLSSIGDQNTLVLIDGSKIEGVDRLIFATGYNYDFRFCHPENLPWSRAPLQGASSSRRVHHLDSLQTFYYEDTTFAFLALNSSIVPFPFAEHQAHAIASRWSSRSTFELLPFPNETDESPAVHALPPPAEFELQNRLLDLIGEGQSGQGWGHVPEWKYTLRSASNELRKRELGY